MQILHDLKISKDSILTIGNFDALHLGHLALLNAMQKPKVVLTFTNHPQAFFSGKEPLKLLSLPHKLHLFELYGVDAVILLPFNEELSKKTAEEFLHEIPFSKLVLGYDARIGHKREGTPEILTALSKKMGFELAYMPPVVIDERPISSSRVKEFVRQGELKRAEELLGRPYSLFGSVVEGLGKGKSLGFPTLNLNVTGLVLPPLGVYAVKVFFQGKAHKSVANLGFSPTLRNATTPILEAHIPSFEEDLYGKQVEIIFSHFIRQEKKFLSVEDLKNQIAKDIVIALNHG